MVCFLKKRFQNSNGKSFSNDSWPKPNATSKEKSIKAHNCWSFEVSTLSSLSKHSREKWRERKLLHSQKSKEKIFWDSKASSSSKNFTPRRSKCPGVKHQARNLHLHQSSFFRDFFKWGHLESLFYLIKFLYFGYIIHLPICGFSFVS